MKGEADFKQMGYRAINMLLDRTKGYAGALEVGVKSAIFVHEKLN